MALIETKVEIYKYENYLSDTHERRLNSPKNKLLEKLSPYSMPSSGAGDSMVEIPSIPGTKVDVVESTNMHDYSRDIKAKLYYLENANEQDLNEIRKIIKKILLVKKVYY